MIQLMRTNDPNPPYILLLLACTSYTVCCYLTNPLFVRPRSSKSNPPLDIAQCQSHSVLSEGCCLASVLY